MNDNELIENEDYELAKEIDLNKLNDDEHAYHNNEAYELDKQFLAEQEEAWNAYEQQQRECMNDAMQELARQIPYFEEEDLPQNVRNFINKNINN